MPTHIPHQQSWRTIPIFISSTFSDMQAERDYLRQIVFPRLEEELESHRMKLEMVDLRWGINTNDIEKESDRETNVLRVCLDEIKRCRPFFIGLLGDRYGWIPPSKRIQTTLEQEQFSTKPENKSVTALEIEFGVLTKNIKQINSSFYFREPLPYHQMDQSVAWLYSDEFNSSYNFSEKQTRKETLSKLKSDIIQYYERHSSSSKVRNYKAEWDFKNGKVTGLEQWGEMIYQDILTECKQYAEDTWQSIPQDWVEKEMALLDAFTTRNSDNFCGRTKLLQEIQEELLSPTKASSGIVLTGESGSGKSAVFSQIYKMLEHQECIVLAHSTGISPRSRSVLYQLTSWNKQIRYHLNSLQIEYTCSEQFQNDDPSHIKEDESSRLNSEIAQFKNLLFTLARHKNVVLLVDSLDNYEDTPLAKSMTWLPLNTPSNVRMLCTAITNTETKLVDYHSELRVVKLPDITIQEALLIIRENCSRQHKSLPLRIQKAIISQKRANGHLALSNPLWLNLIMDMLINLDAHDFEQINKRGEVRDDMKIESYMIDMINSSSPLPGNLFLELIEKAGSVFGEDFTHKVFHLLATSRNGLRISDLQQIFEQEEETWTNLAFANLRRWFRRNMTLHGEEQQWKLGHTILRSAIVDNLDKEYQEELHRILSNHFDLLNDEKDSLGLTEFIYHLLHCQRFDTVAGYYIYTHDEEAEQASRELADFIRSQKDGLTKIKELPSLFLNFAEDYPENQETFYNGLFSLFEKFNNYLHPLLDEENQVEISKIWTVDILDKAIKYLPKDITHPVLAIFYSNLVSDELVHNNYETAHLRANRYISILEDLLADQPEDLPIKRQLAVAFSFKAMIFDLEKDHENAYIHYTKRLNILREIHHSLPDSLKILYDLQVTYEQLSILAEQLNKTEVLLTSLNKWIKYGEELHMQIIPSDETLVIIAKAYLKKGDFHNERNEYEQAHKCYQRCFELHKQLYIISPSTNYRLRLVLTFGRLFIATSISKILTGKARKSELLINPDKFRDTTELFPSIYRELGDLFVQEESYSYAVIAYDYEMERLANLQKKDKDDRNIKFNIIQVSSIFYLLLAQTGYSERATKYCDLYIETCFDLCISSSNNKNLYILMLAKAYSEASDFYNNIEDRDLAKEYDEKETSALELVPRILIDNKQKFYETIDLSENLNHLEESFKEIMALESLAE